MQLWFTVFHCFLLLSYVRHGVAPARDDTDGLAGPLPAHEEAPGTEPRCRRRQTTLQGERSHPPEEGGSVAGPLVTFVTVLELAFRMPSYSNILKSLLILNIAISSPLCNSPGWVLLPSVDHLTTHKGRGKNPRLCLHTLLHRTQRQAQVYYCTHSWIRDKTCILSQGAERQIRHFGLLFVKLSCFFS